MNEWKKMKFAVIFLFMATYRIGPDGEPHMIREKSVFVDIPASVIAEFLLNKFGKTAILGEE